MSDRHEEAYGKGYEAGKSGSVGGDLGKMFQDLLTPKNDYDKSYDAGYEAGSKERSFDWSFSSDSGKCDNDKSSDSKHEESSNYDSPIDYSSSDYSDSDYTSSDYNYTESSSSKTPNASKSNKIEERKDLSYSNEETELEAKIKHYIKKLFKNSFIAVVIISIILFIIYLANDKDRN